MIFEFGGKSGVFWQKSGVSFLKLSGNTGNNWKYNRITELQKLELKNLEENYSFSLNIIPLAKFKEKVSFETLNDSTSRIELCHLFHAIAGGAFRGRLILPQTNQIRLVLN